MNKRKDEIFGICIQNISDILHLCCIWPLVFSCRAVAGFVCYREKDYVFTWEDGRPFSPDYVTKAFKKIVTRSETLPSELVFHDLRKSCVSIMIADGHSIKEVQKWVGHSDISTTLNIYAKVKESRKKENTGLSNNPVFLITIHIEATRFELATSASRTQRSTKLSHASSLCISYYMAFVWFCQAKF